MAIDAEMPISNRCINRIPSNIARSNCTHGASSGRHKRYKEVFSHRERERRIFGGTLPARHDTVEPAAVRNRNNQVLMAHIIRKRQSVGRCDQGRNVIMPQTPTAVMVRFITAHRKAGARLKRAAWEYYSARPPAARHHVSADGGHGRCGSMAPG